MGSYQHMLYCSLSFLLLHHSQKSLMQRQVNNKVCHGDMFYHFYFLFFLVPARVAVIVRLSAAEQSYQNLPAANGSPVCWFCLVLCQRFFLSGRMSALCARPSPRRLDVSSSTWSLPYLLSSRTLPSRCSATWNAWLGSSLKTSWNCVLKRCMQTVPALSTHQPCVQEPEKGSSTAAQSKGEQTKHPIAIWQPSLWQRFLCWWNIG